MTTQVAGPLVAQEADRKSSVYEQLDLFGDIFERIRAQYVESVDEAELIEAAINGMLTSLDPHSGFLTADDAADMRVQTKRRVRGPRDRGDPGRGVREGRVSDGWHTGRRRRDRGGRLHYPCRRRIGSRPHARRSRRHDARPGGVRKSS